MIIIENLSKEFDDIVVLKDINLTLEKGKIYGFIGSNGSGKTILFKMVAGFLKPTKGIVKISNKVIGKDIDFPTSCGVIIESPGFINSLSGYKNLKILADIRGIIGEDEIKGYMEMLGLDPSDKKKVKTYSLGMNQKLGIIQALMEDPQILILDEPMNALDEKSVKKVREILLNIKSEKIILLSSHNKEDIELLCDEIYKVEDLTIRKMK